MTKINVENVRPSAQKVTAFSCLTIKKKRQIMWLKKVEFYMTKYKLRKNHNKKHSREEDAR